MGAKSDNFSGKYISESTLGKKVMERKTSTDIHFTAKTNLTWSRQANSDRNISKYFVPDEIVKLSNRRVYVPLLSVTPLFSQALIYDNIWFIQK